MWPAKAYADTCVEGYWKNATAKPIPLDHLIETILPNLQEEGTAPGVFFRSGAGSVDVSAEQLATDLTDYIEENF